MVYLQSASLPTEGMEFSVLLAEKRTYVHSAYPFKIFPQMGLHKIDFDGITMFYGGNGSGKSTLINVLARKMDAVRYSAFNDSQLFERYTQLCNVRCTSRPKKCYVLSSDDVFDYVLNARYVNDDIDERRKALLDQYVSAHHEVRSNAEIMRMKGMDDYERWNTTMEILSKKHTQSSFIKKRVERDVDLRSNGESAMHYFLERIGEDGLYFLDEPENSLSVEFQCQLAEFIVATARASRCQFVIATHSPILLSMVNARIYNLDGDPASVCEWTELPNVRKLYDFFMEHDAAFRNG